MKPKLMKMLHLLLFKEAKPIDDLTIIKRKEKLERKRRTSSMGSEGSTTMLNDSALMSESSRAFSEMDSDGNFS